MCLLLIYCGFWFCVFMRFLCVKICVSSIMEALTDKLPRLILDEH